MPRVILSLAAFLHLLLLFLLCAPLALLWPTLAWRNCLSLAAGRIWSNFCLSLLGIRVSYQGLEQIQHPCILTFNHSSYLDFMVNSALVGTHCLVFGKRELARLPFLGWGWRLGGHPMIRRDDRAQWQAELDRVARLMREEGYSTIVAPEGHRSRDGTLLPFKKGAFHLALQTRLPVQPVVIHGGAERMRGGFPQPGEMRVEVLPPVSTEEWQLDSLEEHLEVLRAQYLEALEQGSAPVEANRPS